MNVAAMANVGAFDESLFLPIHLQQMIGMPVTGTEKDGDGQVDDDDNNTEMRLQDLENIDSNNRPPGALHFLHNCERGGSSGDGGGGGGLQSSYR